MKQEKTVNTEKFSIAKMLLWNVRGISLGAVTIIIGYLSMYCTDVLGMPAALVGTLLMVSRVVDGITDLFAGWLVDNTRTKLGKGRPYELCLIGVWVCMYLLFATGVNWSMQMKCVWLVLIYTLIFSVFATLLNAAETPYMLRVFRSSMVVTKVASYGGIFVTLGTMVISVSFPILVGSMGSTAAGWRKIMLIYAVPLLLIGLLRFIFIKEVQVPESEKVKGKTTLKDILSVLKSNKYIWFFATAVIIPQVVKGMSAGTYYFATVVGDIKQYSVISLLSIVALIFLFIVPKLSKKYMPMELIMYSSIIGIIGCVINFAAGSIMPLLIIGGILNGVSTVPCSYLKTPIIMQIANYNEANGKPRMEATIASTANFLNKIGSAFGAFILGIMLSAGGYDGALSVQPDSAVMAVRLAYSLVPALFMAICIVCTILFRPLNKFTKELNEKKNENQGH